MNNDSLTPGAHIVPIPLSQRAGQHSLPSFQAISLNIRVMHYKNLTSTSVLCALRTQARVVKWPNFLTVACVNTKVQEDEPSASIFTIAHSWNIRFLILLLCNEIKYEQP
jgi:hypothetical protein